MDAYIVNLTLQIEATADFDNEIGTTFPVAVQTASACVSLLCSGFNIHTGNGSFIRLPNENKVKYSTEIQVPVRSLAFTFDHDFQAAIVAAEDALYQDLEKLYQSFPLLMSVDCTVIYTKCTKEVLTNA